MSFGFEIDQGLTAFGVVEVDGLGDVEVKLFSGRNADVESVALDRIENLLRVLIEHGAGSRKGGILRRVERRLGGLPGQRIGRGSGVFQSSRGGTKEGGGEEFDFSPIVCFQDVAPSNRLIRP